MMMKICVFSDSHGNKERMILAVKAEDPALCVFLGDGERDLKVLRDTFPDLPVYAVRGNCDLRSAEPEQLFFTAGGKNIFATHGHLYDVKYDPGLFGLLDASGGADIVLFGHTHRALKENRNGQEILNPGSVGSSSFPSYGLIEIGRYGVRTELCFL